MTVRVGRALAPTTILALLTSGCGASPDALEDAVKDKPGVVSVEAEPSQGDDWLPFATIPSYLVVVMKDDASAAQVMAVFEEYQEEIDDGEVFWLKVLLDDRKRAALTTGERIYPEGGMVQDLVDAQGNDDVLRYRREIEPEEDRLDVKLRPLALDDVIAVADANRDGVIDHLQVRSGGFRLVRDAASEDPSVTDARERFLLRAGRRFRLDGAVSSGRGPLKLFVVRADAVALQAYVDSAAGPTLGRVVVRVRSR